MYFEEDQVSLFAVDTQSTKTSQALSVATTERIGKQSSRNSSASQTQTPRPFLFLQKGSGVNGEDIWEKDLTVGGLLPLGCMTHNGMGSLKGDAGYVYSLTTADGQRTGYCLTLNTEEKPRTPIIEQLSNILEKSPNLRKYQLSPKACIGILRRAERRGKKLPEALERALRAQSAPKIELRNLEAEKESSSSVSEQELCQRSQTSQFSTVCIEGNGARQSHFGNGWRESDQMYTLNTTEQHAVAYGISPYASNAMLSDNPTSGIYKADTSRTLDLNGGSPACNQGGIAIVEPTVLESNQNHATISQSGVCTTLPAAMGMGGGYVPMVTEPVVYQGECITSPQNKANPQPGDPCHTLTDDTRNYLVQAAGFSPGQSANARTLGYSEEVSATLSGGGGGNNKPCVYDARGNGDGNIANTLTGDHQDRITDYTAICVSEPVCMATSCVNAETTDNGISPALLARAGTGGNQLPIIADATAYSMQAFGDYKESDAASALKMRDYKDATDLISQVAIGLDRSSFNQGANAQFDFSAIEEQQPTLTSRGPGGVCAGVANGGRNTKSHNGCRSGAVVRRLTPNECELLQGFPSNWTRIGEPREVNVNDYRYSYDSDGNEISKEFVGTHTETEYFYTDESGKPKRLADSVRYKALGNSCALPFWQWLDGRISSEYVGTCTLGSLFDGISAFPLVHARHNGPKSVRWSSEIEEFPIAVSKAHFGDEAIGLNGDIDQFLWR